MTPLQSISLLVGEVNKDIRVMAVTDKPTSTTVAVESQGERITVNGQYKIGTRLIISLGEVLGEESQDERTFYET